MEGKLRKAICTKIDDFTWRFDEKFLGIPVYMYLLVGDEKALLIDTGYGFTDVPAAIREITDLPLLVINTHGHFDHMHGNHLYPEVMLHDADAEVFARQNDYEQNMRFFKELICGSGIPRWLFPLLKPIAKPAAVSYPSKRVGLPKEMCIELGCRKVTILETPGHTIGSISLLDEKNKWLFCGDMGCEDDMLLNFPESSNVSTFHKSMERLTQMAEDGAFTNIFPSHQATPLTPGILKGYLEASGLLLSGQFDSTQMNKGVFTHKNIKITIGEREIQ